MGLCKVADSGLQLVKGVSVAERVEAVSVDACLIFLEAEETGLRISGLLGLARDVETRRGRTCASGVMLPTST